MRISSDIGIIKIRNQFGECKSSYRFECARLCMFTRNHVATYRSQVVEAMPEGDLVSLLVLQRPLEPDEEGVGEDLSGRSRGDQHGRSQALQPHVNAVADHG